MKLVRISVSVAVLSLMLAFMTARPADAIIHEMVGADCRVGGHAPAPAGQLRDGVSFARALQATGIIESVVPTATAVTINFDLSKPAAKYRSAGFALTIPDFFGPGVALVLNPLPIPDPGFPAFANCKNLNP